MDRWLPIVQLWQAPWTWVGGGIIVAALLVNIFCDVQLYREGTTVIPFRQSTTLVTKGLYRWSRNPIYLSMVILLYGEAIALGSLSPWLVPTAFATLISQRFIRHEETMLADTFGEAYRDYCKKVRRWL